MDTDLLVLGGGMAGLSAAAWSVRQGRSVVLVTVVPAAAQMRAKKSSQN